MRARYGRRTEMGWFHDDAPGCEGYIVGLVRESGRYRELRYPHDNKSMRPHAVQGACECGWRSSRFRTPLRAEYGPFSVHMNDERAEEEIRELWRAHIATPHVKVPNRACLDLAARETL